MTPLPDKARAKRLLGRYAFPGLMLAVALVLILRPSGCTERGGGRERPPGALVPGEVVPAFSARTLDGTSVSFPADFRGKLVLLDFWATWCPPCREEIPRVAAVYSQFRAQGLEILGVSLDQPYHAPEEVVRRFVQAQNMTWPQVYDGAAGIAGEYRVSAIPAAFLVDGDSGRLLADGDELRGGALARTIAGHCAHRPASSQRRP